MVLTHRGPGTCRNLGFGSPRSPLDSILKYRDPPAASDRSKCGRHHTVRKTEWWEMRSHLLRSSTRVCGSQPGRLQNNLCSR